MTELTPGAPAPDFRLPDAGGRPVALGDFAGGKLIVFFYPAAMTPGCTVEAVDFTAGNADFLKAGYSVVGISPDKPEVLAKFIARNDLDLTLLSDPEKTVIAAYGAWGERNLYGKVVTGVLRSTFVIDVDAAGHGTITDAQYRVRATGHVKRLRDGLGV